MLAIIFAVLFVVSLIFGLYAFSKEQDYKKNSDQKAAVAVVAAKKQQSTEDQAKFDELNKQPYKSFTGPALYGTVSFNYPKSWSAYIDNGATEPINGYFSPGEVPGVQGSSAYRLRVELTDSDYSQVVQQYTVQATDGSVRSVAYVPPKMKDMTNVQAGVKLTGTVSRGGDGADHQGEMVILKVRDKTLQIYTETTDGISDFESIVLPSLSFIP
jgi:uncharacterized protein YpmB